jgi:hypothetical protein
MAAAGPATLLSLPSEGVSLAALRALAAASAGRDVALPDGAAVPFDSLSTMQVASGVVKPLTADTQDSYARQLIAQARARAHDPTRTPTRGLPAFSARARALLSRPRRRAALCAASPAR